MSYCVISKGDNVEDIGLAICKSLIAASICGIGILLGKFIILMRDGVIFRPEDYNE